MLRAEKHFVTRTREAVIIYLLERNARGRADYEKEKGMDMVSQECVHPADYIQYLSELIPEKDSLKLVKTEAADYYKTHTVDECFDMGLALYDSDNFQIQEVGVFLLGYSAHEYKDALFFLKNEVSTHESWKVQEILAMAFDNHCRIIGYENALPLIKEWLGSDKANVRRAVTEGLRVWTSRPYFKDHPQAAIDLLSANRGDESEYARKSVGNALRDISKKHPELVAQELRKWDLSSKGIRQLYKLAGKFVEQELAGRQ